MESVFCTITVTDLLEKTVTILVPQWLFSTLQIELSQNLILSDFAEKMNKKNIKKKDSFIFYCMFIVCA